LASLENFLILKAATYQSEEIKVRFVGTLLAKDALAWFSTLVSEGSPLLSDWNMFLQEFKNLFENPHARKQAQASIQRLKQGKGSVLTYASRFRALKMDTGYNAEALISTFRRGLNDSVQDVIATSLEEPTDLEQFINLAIKIDNRLYSRKMERSSSAHPPSMPSTSYTKPVAQRSDPMDLGAISRPSNGKLTREERDRRFKENLCLYCGSSNHKINECDKRKQKNFRIDKSVAAISPRNAGSFGPILIKVTLLLSNGQSINTEALVDSGATSNFINPDTFQGEGEPLDSSLEFN
jgi:hypothetical protein